MGTARDICMALGLFLAVTSVLEGEVATAGNVSVSILMSADSARVIRDWRRAHGLPQAAEPDEAQGPVSRADVGERHAVADRMMRPEGRQERAPGSVRNAGTLQLIPAAAVSDIPSAKNLRRLDGNGRADLDSRSRSRRSVSRAATSRSP